MTNTTFKVLHTNILFQFEDDLMTAQGVRQFREKTNWGFDLGANYDRNIKKPRWVRVVAVGPKVTEVQVGMRVLVEALKWTDGVTHSGDTVWLTNEDQIMAVDESVAE